jgi:hypothetical protein
MAQLDTAIVNGTVVMPYLRRAASLLAAALLALAAMASAADQLTIAAVELGNDVVGIRLGGPGADWARRIRCGAETCAIFGHTIKSFGSSTDFLAMVETAEQRLRWARTYGGTHREELADVAPAADAGYLLVGASQSLFFTGLKALSPSRPPRPLMLRIDGAGVPQWARTLDDKAVTSLSAVASLPGGGHIVVGFGPKSGGTGIVALRVDADGGLRWARRYDFGESTDVTAVLARRTDVVIVGYGYAAKAVTATLVFAIDMEGQPGWARRYTASPTLIPIAAAGDAEGRVIVVGAARGTAAESHPASMKLEPDGAWTWTRLYRGPKTGEALAVSASSAGEYAIAGRMGDVTKNEQDGLALLVDAQGQPLASVAVRGSGNVELMGIVPWRDGRYRVVGDTEAFGATAVDILSLIWAPARTGASVPIVSSEVPTDAKSVTPSVVSVTPRVVDIAPSQLVSAVVSIPAP